MTLDELNKKVQDFNFEVAFDKIMLENSKVFVDANKEMLYSGIDATGTSLGEYANSTKQYKQEKGQPYDRITLKDSGDFYLGKRLISEENFDYTIESNDYKQEILNEDFGIEINGIDKERTIKIIDEVLTPKLTQAIQNVIS